MNGTNKQRLREEVEEANNALEQALNALNNMSPHMRDYYIDPDPQAFQTAVEQQNHRLHRLRDVQAEIACIYEGLLNQGLV